MGIGQCNVSPVRVVTVLTRHPAGPVRVQGSWGELHPDPGQFADPEVLAGLAGELERGDELAAAGGPVLAQPEGRVHALTHARPTSARHHLEAARRHQAREAARADRPPGTPARAWPRNLGPSLGHCCDLLGRPLLLPAPTNIGIEGKSCLRVAAKLLTYSLTRNTVWFVWHLRKHCLTCMQNERLSSDLPLTRHSVPSGKVRPLVTRAMAWV